MMSSPVPRKLRSSFEGVLAGGADPSSSALYSFGPFVKGVAVAGVAGAGVGLSIWLVLLAMAAAVLVYGLVMRWVRNGGGATALSEEEFGGWAIKLNGGVTFVLYIVAFLVSIAAAATFLADRLPVLRSAPFAGIEGRTWAASALTLAIAWLVNNRPRAVARIYGPATAAVVALLWGMIVATVVERGIHLPVINLHALDPQALLGVTLAGFTRLLAMLTGIEVFATLEPAFEGVEAERSRKAFGSLLLVTFTSAAVLLLLGPVIVAVTQPGEPVSVFTQAMDSLLPGPLAMLGTVIAIAVLLVVAAASAQGLQNLVLGLHDRRFAPAFLGQRNRADVPDWPVRILAAACIACLLLLGSDPGVYVRVYVAGFILILTLTSWAAARRARQSRREAGTTRFLVMATLAAALFVSATAIVVVIEGFLEGVFVYFVLAPVFFLVFHYTRRAMGSPNPLREELGRREGSMRAVGAPPGATRGGQAGRSRLPSSDLVPAPDAVDRGAARRWSGESAHIGQVVLALDGSEFSARALPSAQAICKLFDASLILATVLPARGAPRVLPKGRTAGDPLEAGQVEAEAYLSRLVGQARATGIRAEYYVASGPVAQALDVLTRELEADLLVMSTHGRSGVSRFMLGSNASATIQLVTCPVLLLRTQTLPADKAPTVRRVMAPLDGSSFAEQIIPWVQAVAAVAKAEIVLLTVPEVPEPALYGALSGAVDELRERAEANARRYVEGLAVQMSQWGINARPLVRGSRPATAILEAAEAEHVDLIMLATHGRGGVDRLVMGSVADRVVHHASCPVLLAPVREKRGETDDRVTG